MIEFNYSIHTNYIDTNYIDTNYIDTNYIYTKKSIIYLNDRK